MGKRDGSSAARPTSLASLVARAAGGCAVIGIFSVGLSRPGEWYDTLHKPGWTPPIWVLRVAWTVLMTLTGVALAIVAQRGSDRVGVGRAAAPFAIQLLLAAAWSPIFFGAQSPAAALGIAILLWLMVGWMIGAFWGVRDIAGVMLIPYWLWVTFVAALNAAIWRMN